MLYSSFLVTSLTGSKRRAFGENIKHAILEFFIGNDAIFVLINFVHDLVPDLLALLETYIA